MIMFYIFVQNLILNYITLLVNYRRNLEMGQGTKIDKLYNVFNNSIIKSSRFSLKG